MSKATDIAKEWQGRRRRRRRNLKRMCKARRIDMCLNCIMHTTFAHIFTNSSFLLVFYRVLSVCFAYWYTCDVYKTVFFPLIGTYAWHSDDENYNCKWRKQMLINELSHRLFVLSNNFFLFFQTFRKWVNGEWMNRPVMYSLHSGTATNKKKQTTNIERVADVPLVNFHTFPLTWALGFGFNAFVSFAPETISMRCYGRFYNILLFSTKN